MLRWAATVVLLFAACASAEDESDGEAPFVPRTTAPDGEAPDGEAPDSGGDTCNPVLGAVWHSDRLLTAVAGVSLEEDCCGICTQLDLCAAWQVRIEGAPECRLYSKAEPGTGGGGAESPNEWIGGTVARNDNGYHCTRDTACKDCQEDSGQCNVCRQKQYLLEGQCVATCQGTGLSPFGDAAAGRVCTTFPFSCNGADCKCPGNSCDTCTVASTDSFVCSSCKAGWLLFGEACLKSATCKNGKVQDKGHPCKCARTCNKCVLTPSEDGGMNEECLVCKRNTYLSDGQCLATSAECPEGTVGMGDFAEGRVCSAPFTCTKRKNSLTGKKCKCTDNRNCLSCRMDTAGSACLKCTNKLYLHEGECQQGCPGFLTHASVGKSNRRCSIPFTCDKGTSQLDGQKCKCPSAKYCRTCQFMAGNAAGEAVCGLCIKGWFLYQGECVKKCPSGTTASNLESQTGRRCEVA